MNLAKKKAEAVAIQKVGKYIHAHTLTTCTHSYRSNVRRPRCTWPRRRQWLFRRLENTCIHTYMHAQLQVEREKAEMNLAKKKAEAVAIQKAEEAEAANMRAIAAQQAREEAEQKAHDAMVCQILVCIYVHIHTYRHGGRLAMVCQFLFCMYV